MALALYRRYRPDTFDGVIGQDQVVVPLTRALDEGKLTHAYLFSGPRGCGKTSSARILARCVNCAEGPTSHPCGTCESCRDLATGGPGSIDVVEIDAASHNGVDDARELRERAGFAPARDRYKIFILDEAHMVTQQGFNALLKIVEEPPEHVMFIFATTEPEKVIGTIRSRTHHYPFRLVPPEIMGPYLEGICDKEGIKPETGVLRLAMRAGGGSMRDTLSVLDQLMVGSVEGVITHDAAIALLGFTPEALISEAVDAIIDHNGEQLYGIIQKVVVGGFDPRRFVEDLLSRVRDLLILSIAGEHAESVLSDDAEAENIGELRRQASALGLARLTSIADIINNALATMSGATSPRMRLELLAARLLVPDHSAMPAAAAAGPDSSAGVNVVSGTAHQRGAAPQQQNAAGSGAGAGFAGARRNRNASPASAQSGFAGAKRHAANQVSTEGVAEKPSATAAEASAANASETPADPQPQGPHSAEAQTQAPIPVEPQPQTSSEPVHNGNAQAVAEQTVQDDRTPDEKWDALVAGLPEDVAKYVSRTKVPRINLSTDRSGRQRLWIKFDTPISKYAFAIGMASESIDGTTKVVEILRNQTHKVFGAQVSLAPTEKMADGQIAPPFSRLPKDEQQRIRTKLAMESAGLSAIVGAGWQSKEHKSTPSGGKTDESAVDDTESHRGSDAADQDELDPWAASANDAYQDLSVVEHHPRAAHHTKQVAVPDLSDDEDPWATPAPAAQPQQPVAGTQPSNESSQAAHVSNEPDLADPWQRAQQQSGHATAPTNTQPLQHASAPVADMSDPWQRAAAGNAQQPVQRGHSDGTSQDGQQTSQQHPQSGWMQAREEHMQHPGAGAAHAWQAAARRQPMPSPQVDPEDDEYSMDDAALGVDNLMDVDELKRFFDVKHEERLAPDDPKNPRNLAAKRKASADSE